ncbi:MAG: ATP-grasp domain-containing protein [Gemmatimonadetes bacterium]|nr:ATP-grasp domain-containing protein [Gemmatimonadota bacterium]
MGIRSVAVHSDADADAPHVAAADAACRIGPAPARESYLDAARVLGAARETGAEAVHPGYGFLSESAAFARACAEAGVVFIGPSPEALEATGDKAGARRTAGRVGVPVVPGRGPSADLQDLAHQARELPFPMLVKAAAGGGGKGMRRVNAAAELDEALRGAAREARAAFGGDDRLLLERYVHPARHIEVQVLGDGRGGVAALGERECSLQRRYQKIVEESPSSAIDSLLRERLLEAARRFASAVRYSGAGTVEFLVAPEGTFHFLEMNARLQVEHPVTELVTGLDLVRLQLELASGERLDLTVLEGRSRGHAIEARLYAEDPQSGFLPTCGTVGRLRWPGGPGVRVDAGIEEASVVGTDYDPLLAKILAWAPDREHARTRLVRALEETALLGFRTNQSFLLELLDSEAFRSGLTFTDTVEGAANGRGDGDPPGFVLAAAAYLLGSRRERTARDGAAMNPREDRGSPWTGLGAWRLGGG